MYCFVLFLLFCFVLFCISIFLYYLSLLRLLPPALVSLLRFEYLAAAHKLIHDETEKTAKLLCRFKTQVQY